jgi:hypothetical protein
MDAIETLIFWSLQAKAISSWLCSFWLRNSFRISLTKKTRPVLTRVGM